MQEKIEQFLLFYLKWETVAAGVLYAFAAAIVFADVFSREALGSSIWGSQRIAILLANAAAFLGIGVATAKNRHIRPIILDNAVPKHYVPLIERLGNFFSALVFFAGAYFTANLVLDNREMGFTADPLKLKIWIPQCVMAYGFASTGLRYLLFGLLPGLLNNTVEGEKHD